MRLAVLVCGFVFGALVGVAGTVVWWWACAAGLVACCVWFGRRRVWILALAALLGLAGQGWAVWQVVAARRLEAGLNATTPGTPLCVQGRAFNVGEATAEDDGGDRFAPSTQRFRVDGHVPKAAWGQAQIQLNVFWVRAPDEGLTVEEGDQVQVCGLWQPPFGFFNPGAGPGWPQVALKAAVGSIRATRVSVRSHASRLWPWRLAARFRQALSHSFAALPLDRAAFLRATVLGERAAVSADVELGFKAAGATHALSVSGLHLAAVAALFFVGLRWLLLRSVHVATVVRVRPWAAALSIPAVLVYTLVTGEAVATWRSALMAACLFAAYAVRRAPALSASLALRRWWLWRTRRFGCWTYRFNSLCFRYVGWRRSLVALVRKPPPKSVGGTAFGCGLARPWRRPWLRGSSRRHWWHFTSGK